MSNDTVCVTGGAGFLGSHVVKLLLHKGYRVHATVRNVHDHAKVAHLRALPGADERLELFEADLLQEGSFDKAIEGCSGVFHTASPFFTQNQTKEALVVPAVQGTLNVLNSCARHSSVRRVVLTSSTASVYVHCGTKPQDYVFTEVDWSNIEGMEKINMWYCVSKTIAEKTAHEFASKHSSFDLVAMCPSLIFGPMLQPVLNESSLVVYNMLSGVTKVLPNSARAVVDVRDVAEAHVAGFENPNAHGRYMLISCATDDTEIRDAILRVDASAAGKVPSHTAPGEQAARSKFDTSKARSELGISFRSLDEMVQGTCASLHEHGFIN